MVHALSGERPLVVNFEALAKEHKDSIYRQMLRVCGNHQDAEDVLIESLMKAYRSMDQLRDSLSFRAWLAQIARRVCWQLKEKEALMPLIQFADMENQGLELPDHTLAPEDAASAAQLREILRSAVEDLKPELRDVYQLRDLEEISGEEVAERLGISLSAMKSRLHRARATVRERIEASLFPPATTQQQVTRAKNRE